MLKFKKLVLFKNEVGQFEIWVYNFAAFTWCMKCKCEIQLNTNVKYNEIQLWNKIEIELWNTMKYKCEIQYLYYYNANVKYDEIQMWKTIDIQLLNTDAVSWGTKFSICLSI